MADPGFPKIAILFLSVLAVGAAMRLQGYLLQRKLDRLRDVPWSPERLREFVAAYRPLGFLADGAEKSLEEQLATLMPLTKGLPGDPRQDWRDDLLALAVVDSDNLWWDDLEADVCDGNKVYEEMLVELAFITQGRFRPANIEEKWESEKGPVAVSFDLSGVRHTVSPEVNDDWIDLGILDGIRALLPEGGPQFEVAEQKDQTATILFLTADQKRGLEALGWKFM